MDRITGSSRPRPERESLMFSQKDTADSGVDPGAGRRTGFEAESGGLATALGVCGFASTTWDGMVLTAGRVECSGGGVELTKAEKRSMTFSSSAMRFGVCATVFGFAGLLRATCSTHSTLAFSHLRHVSAGMDMCEHRQKQYNRNSNRNTKERSEAKIAVAKQKSTEGSK